MSDTVATARSDAQYCDHFVGECVFFTNVGWREGVQGSKGVGMFVEMYQGRVGWYRSERAVGEKQSMQGRVVSGTTRLQRTTRELQVCRRG